MVVTTKSWDVSTVKQSHYPSCCTVHQLHENPAATATYFFQLCKDKNLIYHLGGLKFKPKKMLRKELLYTIQVYSCIWRLEKPLYYRDYAISAKECTLVVERTYDIHISYSSIELTMCLYNVYIL